MKIKTKHPRLARTAILVASGLVGLAIATTTPSATATSLLVPEGLRGSTAEQQDMPWADIKEVADYAASSRESLLPLEDIAALSQDELSRWAMEEALVKPPMGAPYRTTNLAVAVMALSGPEISRLLVPRLPKDLWLSPLPGTQVQATHLSVVLARQSVAGLAEALVIAGVCTPEELLSSLRVGIDDEGFWLTLVLLSDSPVAHARAMEYGVSASNPDTLLIFKRVLAAGHISRADVAAAAIRAGSPVGFDLALPGGQGITLSPLGAATWCSTERSGWSDVEAWRFVESRVEASGTDIYSLLEWPHHPVPWIADGFASEGLIDHVISSYPHQTMTTTQIVVAIRVAYDREDSIFLTRFLDTGGNRDSRSRLHRALSTMDESIAKSLVPMIK